MYFSSKFEYPTGDKGQGLGVAHPPVVHSVSITDIPQRFLVNSLRILVVWVINYFFGGFAVLLTLPIWLVSSMQILVNVKTHFSYFLVPIMLVESHWVYYERQEIFSAI